MKRVLHFDFRPGEASWILRLMSRLDSSSSPKLRRGRRQWAALSLGESAGAIATRMKLVRLLVRRFDFHLNALSKELSDNIAEVELFREKNRAYTLKKSDLAYRLLIDFDMFIFETRSTYEITAVFIRKFFADVLGRTVPGKLALLSTFIGREISNRGGETSWIEELRQNRNLFIHETSAWLALEVNSLAPLKADLVFVKRNVIGLDYASSHLHIDQCRRIYVGFQSVFPILEDWLLAEIEAVEAGSP